MLKEARQWLLDGNGERGIADFDLALIERLYNKGAINVNVDLYNQDAQWTDTLIVEVDRKLEAQILYVLAATQPDELTGEFVNGVVHVRAWWD